MARPELEECDDSYVEAIARIIGESSAAHAAVIDRDRRREAGEDAVVYLDRRGLWVVGPRRSPSPEPHK